MDEANQEKVIQFEAHTAYVGKAENKMQQEVIIVLTNRGRMFIKNYDGADQDSVPKWVDVELPKLS